jgi:cell division protein FtsI/penicillin-binding protein 2
MWRVHERWPRRAPILDRHGRVLAAGPAGKRRYPQGSLAGSTVGHLGDASKKDRKNLPDFYRVGDLFGASGLEAAYNDRLAGSPSQFLQVLNGKHEVVATLGRAPGAPARPLRSTLDVRVQRAAEAGYGSTTGGAVVLDPANGNLLGVVSSSTIDPGDYVGAEDFQPFNYALTGLYPPGSSFKVITASAALDSRKLTPKSTFNAPLDYRGVTNFESESFSSISFAGALAASVNTVFAQIAERVGARLMHDYATRFGFNQAPDPELRAATSSYPRPVDDGELLWSAVGQARDLATPMEMATVAATIANRGVRMEPRLAFVEKPSAQRVVRRKVAGQMNRMMQGVVTGGTGTAAQIPGTPVAGKTGTAEVSVDGTIMNHAWFICFAPADKPRVAVAVVSDLGGIGGEVAAPLARSILEGVLPLTRP